MFIWAYGSRVMGVHCGREAWQQAAGMGQEQVAEWSHCQPQQEAQRVNRTCVGQGYKHSSPAPSDVLCPSPAPSKVLDSSPAPVMYSVQAPPTVMYSIQAPPPVIYSVQAPPPSDALPLVMSHLHQMPTNNPTKCSSNVRPRGTSLV